MALFLLSLIACGPDRFSDDLSGDEDELLNPGDEADGKLALDREDIVAEHVCGTQTETITLSNVGEGVLEISNLDVDGEGWTLDAPALPLFIDPGGETALELVAGAGEATLSIDGPVTAAQVPLVAVEDAAPVVSMTSPAASATVDVGDVLALEAWVEDDADEAEDLTVRWRSDLDGEVDAYPPLPDGLISADWIANQMTAGSHTLTLSVTDSCGNTTEHDASVCQEGGYALADAGATRFEYAGDAVWLPEDECIRLTPDEQYQTGAAFMTAHEISAAAVEIEFDFFAGGADGADGFSLTALDSARYTTLLGAEGCSLGYGDAAAAGCIDGAAGLPGWSIEVDTYYNPEIDASDADHIAMSIDGDQTSTEFYVEIPDVEDDAWHTMKVSSADGRILVAIDGATLVDEVVYADLDFDAFVGFTAATGGDTNLHLVDNLRVREGYCQ